MPNFRRHWIENQIHFQTHVTRNRMPILIGNFDLLQNAIKKVIKETDFDLVAWVVLPDHFHMLINAGENDPSSIIRRFKLSFSSNYRMRYNLKRGRIWQYRFWNHVIMNQIDFNNHVDYIHYNPVKHGLTNDPFAFEFSSLRDYHKEGLYERDWGVKDQVNIEGLYGE